MSLTFFNDFQLLISEFKPFMSIVITSIFGFILIILLFPTLPAFFFSFYCLLFVSIFLFFLFPSSVNINSLVSWLPFHDTVLWVHIFHESFCFLFSLCAYHPLIVCVCVCVYCFHSVLLIFRFRLYVGVCVCVCVCEVFFYMNIKNLSDWTSK